MAPRPLHLALGLLVISTASSSSEDVLDIMEGDIRDKIVLDLGMEHVPDADHVRAMQKILYLY